MDLVKHWFDCDDDTLLKNIREADDVSILQLLKDVFADAKARGYEEGWNDYDTLDKEILESQQKKLTAEEYETCLDKSKFASDLSYAKTEDIIDFLEDLCCIQRDIGYDCCKENYGEV